MRHHVPIPDTGLLKRTLYDLAERTVPYVLKCEYRRVLLRGVTDAFLGDAHANIAFPPAVLH